MESSTDISTERFETPPGWMTPGATPLASAMVRRPVAQCASCGHALSEGQRYCLECGAASDVAFSLPSPAPTAVIAPEPAPVAAQPMPVDTGKRDDDRRAFAYGALGAGVLSLLVMAAIALGAYLRDPAPAATPAAILPAAVAGPSGASGATATANATLTSDWPAGTNGWTVIVKEFDKGSATVADVQAFKQEVAGNGLEAGALDSDEFASLTANQYVVYAGRYKTEKEAKQALKAVKQRGYPDARVAEVSTAATATESGAKSKGTLDDQALKDLESLPPEERQKAGTKLPDETALPGEPPPKDDKKPGGGTELEEIG
jgi:hypothetical protein